MPSHGSSSCNERNAERVKSRRQSGHNNKDYSSLQELHAREEEEVRTCEENNMETLRSVEKEREEMLRAHCNDMENIFPFLFLGAIYSLLDPSPTVARIHFLIFCVGRIIHTIAYLLRLRAPTRSVAYGVAQLPCFSMALQILLATTPYW
ncbi:Prostaglandin E synthase [Turdus rufiventris]|nr:Prostaglandin E synthase [Turdus rufiventris]